MKDKFTSFLFIWLFGFIVLFSLPHGACADGDMSGNLNTRGQAPVAVIDYLTAVTNQSDFSNNQPFSVISKTDDPGFKQSICVDGHRLSAITGVNNIPAGYATVTASLKHTSPEAVAQLKWYVNGVTVQTGSVSYAFSAAGRSIGKYKVEARLHGNVKAVNIYVVNCSYILATQNTTSSEPINLSIGAIIEGNIVGHASWRLDIYPNEAKKAIPFNIYDTNHFNNFVGFHANNRTVVATSGIVNSPIPTFDCPDVVSPTKMVDFPVTVPMLYSMMSLTDSMIFFPDNYILGEYGEARDTLTGLIHLSWTHPHSRNCVSTALSIGFHGGLEHILSNYYMNTQFWKTKKGLIYIEYQGEAPCFLESALNRDGL
ncbi:MAG: hypothetical protein K6G44_17920 [Lentisphaeria bacterium]|nr:hypothetical protein [Lentisphaeria bacterium]